MLSIEMAVLVIGFLNCSNSNKINLTIDFVSITKLSADFNGELKGTNTVKGDKKEMVMST